jgi:RIO kinase 3
MFNLQRLQRAGIPCPTPVLLKKHVLFLSFIGKDTVPAQRLRDVILSPEELANAYQQCLNVRFQFIIEFCITTVYDRDSNMFYLSKT